MAARKWRLVRFQPPVAESKICFGPEIIIPAPLRGLMRMVRKPPLVCRHAIQPHICKRLPVIVAGRILLAWSANHAKDHYGDQSERRRAVRRCETLRCD